MSGLPREKEALREYVWIEAWCAVASASNITRPKIADEWADHCLDQFDQRFRAIPDE